MFATNARTAKQTVLGEKALDFLQGKYGDDLEFIEAELYFKNKTVTLTVDGEIEAHGVTGDIELYLANSAAVTKPKEINELEADSLSDEEIELLEAEQARLKVELAKLEGIEAKRNAEDVKKQSEIEQLNDEIAKEVEGLVDSLVSEHSNSVGRNGARLAKGAVLARMLGYGKRLAQLGDKSLNTMRKVVTHITEVGGSELQKAKVAIGNVLSENEASLCSNTYEAWCKDFGGTDSSFNLLFLYDPAKSVSIPSRG